MNLSMITPRLRKLTQQPALCALAAVTGLLFAGAGQGAFAQTAPKYLVSTTTTLATPTGFGGPNGNIATDKFGNLFVPDAANSQVLEFPVNGGAPIVIFKATAKPQVSGVTVDSANNLYITTRYDSGLSATETDIFKFPYTSNGYPGAYTYGGSAAPTCSATSTSVCNYGNYLQTAGYYYQPQAIGFDGAGNGYMITTYDSLNKAGGLTIFKCDVQCGYDADSASLAVNPLPTAATSLAVGSGGDLYWVDGNDVYYSPANTGKVVLFDTSLENKYGGAQGVNFDRAGNLYASNGVGTFEYPIVGGAIKAASKFQVTTAYVYTGSAIGPNGDVYSSNYSAATATNLYNYNFGSVVLAASAPLQTFTLTFLSAGTFGTLVSQQAGVASTEFPVALPTAANGGCVAGTAYTAGQTCTFTVGFTPTAVGNRRGSVIFTDSTGFQTTTYVIGVGQGTGVTVDPGTPTTITSTLKAPAGLAVDAAGNLFVADATAKAVYEYVGGTGTPVTIGSGFTKPTGVATDGGGSLYVVDQTAGTVQVFANTGGTFATAGTTLATGLTTPTDIVVSGTGAFYVSNTGANAIVQYPNASRIGSVAETSTLGVALSGPTGLSLDPSGNLYVADTGNNRTVQIATSGAQTPFGTGLNAPTGVSAEPSGSVIIADQGNGRLIRVPNEAGTLTTADQVVLSQPVANPYAIRLSGSGNLYVSDNQLGMVDVLQRTAGTLTFGISNVNTTSAAQTIVVSSTGTKDLALGSPFFTAPPASSNFTLTTGSGSAGCTAGTLSTGRDCTLTSTFNPTSIGAKTYTAALNAAAANAATPSIQLVGQGVQLVGVNVTLAKTSPTGTVSYGVPVVLTASVASASASSTAVPTGTVTFNVDGSNSKPVALVNGAASITLTGLGGNTSHVIVATYNGGTVYASGNSTSFAFTVQPATLTAVLSISADDQAPLSSVPGDPVSFSVVITPSILVSGGLTGTVNFVSNGVVIGTSAITQNSSTSVYSAGFSTTTLAASCLAGQTLPNCSNIYNFQAVFAGNGNYSGFSTATQPVVITVPTYSVVVSNPTITSSAAQYGTTTVAVTSYSAYQAGVALSCTGLPANAYCVFRPGLLSLTYVVQTIATPTTPAVSIIPVQTTTMEVRVDQDPVTIQSASSFGLLGLLTGTALFAIGYRRRGLRGLALCCILGVLGASMLGGITGCGNGTSNAYPTPAGTYKLGLVATASPITASGQPPNVINITSITPTAATATVPAFATLIDANTNGLFTAGESVTISGVTPAAYNGTFTITNNTPAPFPGQTTNYYDVITFPLPAGASGVGTGGQIRAGNLSTTQTVTLIAQ